MSIFASDKTTAESGRLNVIAEIKAKAGHADEVKAMLSGLVGPTRDEEGCKSYHLLESRHAPGTFFTYEEWTGEAELMKHLEGAKPLLDKAKPLLDGEMKLTRLDHLV